MNRPGVAPLPLRLGHVPVVEAVWEVRFSSDEQAIGELLIGKIHERFKAEIEQVERLPSANLPPEIRDKQTQLRYLPTLRLKGEKYIINVGDHVALIGCLRPYSGWPAFRPKIDELISVLRDSGLLARPERYSLKYVDLLSHATAPTLTALAIRLRFGNHELTTEPSQIRFEFERRGFVNVVQAKLPVTISFENGDKETGVLIDVDTIRMWKNPEDAAGFWADVQRNLADAHDLNKEIFFNELMTPETTALYDPVYED